MIQRKGHFIEESSSGGNSQALCLKCDQHFQTPQGSAAAAPAFDNSCRGNWEASWKRLEDRLLEASGELARLHQWIRMDQKQQPPAKYVKYGKKKARK